MKLGCSGGVRAGIAALWYTVVRIVPGDFPGVLFLAARLPGHQACERAMPSLFFWSRGYQESVSARLSGTVRERNLRGDAGGARYASHTPDMSCAYATLPVSVIFAVCIAGKVKRQ